MSRTFFLLFAFVTFLAGPVAAQTPAAPAPSTTPPIEGLIRIGGAGSSTTGDLTRVGEYQTLEDAEAQLGFQVWGERGSSRFDFQATHGGTARNQRYRLDLNVNRRVKAVVRYDRLPHRLDHDPLTWMSAASNIGGGPFIVQGTDNDPGAQYELSRAEFESRVEVLAAAWSNGALKFFAGHRQEMRDGHHQALTTSHCEACHTQSFTRQIDQRTRDLIAGTRFANGPLSLDYTFTHRRFDEDAATLTTVYDRALQPAARTDVFLNRVIYDDRAGTLPFDTVPGLERTSHVLKARVDLPGRAAAFGTYTATESRNLDTELQTLYKGLSGRLVVPLGKRVTLRGSVRRYDLESDSVFVDLAEQVAPAGPSAGLTYAEAYPTLGQVDFVRDSSLSRTPTFAQMDVIYRPYKRTTVRLGYDWEELRRDHFEVERTTTNTINAAARGVIDKRVSWQSKAVFNWIADPFTREQAAVPLALQTFVSPGNVPFTGLQYYEMYRSRQADLTAYPTRRAHLEQMVTWSPTAHFSLTGHYRYRDAQNDDLNFGTWGQSVHAPGAQAWFAPSDRVMLHAGFIHQRERTETMFSTLAFVG